jgi:hypothetical protein
MPSWNCIGPGVKSWMCSVMRAMDCIVPCSNSDAADDTHMHHRQHLQRGHPLLVIAKCLLRYTLRTSSRDQRKGLGCHMHATEGASQALCHAHGALMFAVVTPLLAGSCPLQVRCRCGDRPFHLKLSGCVHESVASRSSLLATYHCQLAGMRMRSVAREPSDTGGAGALSGCA